MYGRGWLSPEELTQATLHLGDVAARGIAFADVLAHIAVIGTVDGSVPEEKAESEGKPEEK